MKFKKTTLLGVLGLPCPNTSYIQYIQGIKQIHQAITIVPKLNYKAKRYTGGILLWCLLCSASIALAQPNFDKAKTISDKTVANSPEITSGARGAAPLKVGDKLPESFWQQEHAVYANGKTTTQTLEKYKGKLLILDFWATWCGSCIKKFPLSDSLQQRYGDQVKVMLVNTLGTKDSEAKIAQTMGQYGTGLQTIVKDTLITKLFPQVQLPHYVWIENGQVRAITGSEFFTKENVSNAVQRRLAISETIQKRKAKSHEKR
ncbi:TlpA disulfide reductase family protein [uncultured Pedobacter sp.]|uniref:TlpA family protein disulfide reductase n=1 Tax=uncultured Pedobacter sp. TaxID=246139 RepID=UPI00261D3265|nr:TlpA disulfide reductase family protein [uncultured Pedobacter sp.]